MKKIYKEYNNEPIFQFVDSDARNRLLHQYKYDYAGRDYVAYGYVEDGYVEQAEFTRSPFKGAHPVGLIRKAIEWWETVIEEIEHSST